MKNQSIVDHECPSPSGFPNLDLMFEFLFNYSTSILAGVSIISGLGYWVYSHPEDEAPPTDRLTGTVGIEIDEKNFEEFSRDFYRFLKNEKILIKNSKNFGKLKIDDSNSNRAITHLVSIVNPSIDVTSLIYSLSTSIFLDTLSGIGVIPPSAHQPMYVLCPDEKDVSVYCFCFIGSNVESDGAKKWTKWILKIKIDQIMFKNNKRKIEYSVYPNFKNLNNIENFIQLHLE
jgi:hypothetical protein